MPGGQGGKVSTTDEGRENSSPQGEPWNGWFSVHSNICFIFRFLIVRPKIAAAIYGGPTASDGYLSIYSWQIGRHRRAHHQKTLLLRFLHGPWRAGPVTPVKQNRFLPKAVRSCQWCRFCRPSKTPPAAKQTLVTGSGVLTLKAPAFVSTPTAFWLLCRCRQSTSSPQGRTPPK